MNKSIQHRPTKLGKKRWWCGEKILGITGLATTTVINAKFCGVENKISDATELDKEVDYDTKIKTLKENTSLLLIIIKLRVKHLMQR